ncbi:hypothetical protein V2K59_11170 [Pseudomonas alliivorans]|nr:hypothetical protein [Pseudomonas alliivorans]
MFLRAIVPSWFDIENRITHAMGYQGGATYRTYSNERVDSIGLKIRRVSSVRTAFIHAEWEAGRVLRQRYADLDISSVLNDLIDAVSQMAMIVAGSVLTGATVGAGFGAFFGGVGAVPLGVAGAAMGLQVSIWILGMLGLESIAEFFVDGLPKIAEHYMRGIQAAWNGPRGEPGLSPFIQDDPYAQQSATHHIALGHFEVVTLLLGAIVAYLTRGRGNATVLAQEMRGSPKGARLGQWMLEHEDALRKRPEFQGRNSGKGTFEDQKPYSPSIESLSDKRLDAKRAEKVIPSPTSPTYKELQGLNKDFQAHHILPQYLGKMLGYTKNDMLDHPATLITQYSHTGKINPEAMHKAISKYLPPLAGGKPASYTAEQINLGLRKAYEEIGRPELFESIRHLIR